MVKVKVFTRVYVIKVPRRVKSEWDWGIAAGAFVDGYYNGNPNTMIGMSMSRGAIVEYLKNFSDGADITLENCTLHIMSMFCVMKTMKSLRVALKHLSADDGVELDIYCDYKGAEMYCNNQWKIKNSDSVFHTMAAEMLIACNFLTQHARVAVHHCKITTSEFTQHEDEYAVDRNEARLTGEYKEDHRLYAQVDYLARIASSRELK